MLKAEAQQRSQHSHQEHPQPPREIPYLCIYHDEIFKHNCCDYFRKGKVNVVKKKERKKVGDENAINSLSLSSVSDRGERETERERQRERDTRMLSTHARLMHYDC